MDKESSADSSGLSTGQHHTRLYFPDGDVVLSAGDAGSKNAIILRVHRFMLSHHSPVFKDMFAFPAGPNINETYDGVPVVQMPDNPNDLASLIEVLYYPESLELRRYDPDIPLKTGGILTLAKKYDIDSVCTRIIQHFEAEWPTQLRDWYLLARTMEEMTLCASRVRDNDWKKTEAHFPEPACAIRLATEHGLASVLPAAYYRLAIGDMSIHFDDFGEELGEVSARWDLLEREDWRRLSAGKDKLITMCCKMVSAYRVFGIGGCKTEAKCKEIGKRMLKTFDERWNWNFARQPDVLGLIFEVLDNDSEDLCHTCNSSFECELTDLLEKIWDDLPKIFQLPEFD